MKNSSSRQTTISQGLSRFADIFGIAIAITLGAFGALIGPTATIGMSYNVRENAQLIGFIVGLIVGGFVGIFFAYLLKGFSVIVAWYEATPPGYTSIVRPDSSTPTQTPATPAPALPRANMPDNDRQPEFLGDNWKCICGAVHSRLVSTCNRCGSAKPDKHERVAKYKPSAAPAPARRKNAGSFNATHWVCTCGSENPVSRGSCEQCGGAKPYRS